MVPAGVAYTALAATLIGVAIAQHTMPHTGVAYIVPLSALVADISIAQRWIMAGRLARDLRIGRIVIARKPVDKEGVAALSDATEFLPASKLVWTHAGLPAPWRKAQRPKSPKR